MLALLLNRLTYVQTIYLNRNINLFLLSMIKPFDFSEGNRQNNFQHFFLFWSITNHVHADIDAIQQHIITRTITFTSYAYFLVNFILCILSAKYISQCLPSKHFECILTSFNIFGFKEYIFDFKNIFKYFRIYLGSLSKIKHLCNYFTRVKVDNYLIKLWVYNKGKARTERRRMDTQLLNSLF